MSSDAPEKKKMGPKEQEVLTQKLTDDSWSIIESWIDLKKYDDMSEWMELFRSTMKAVQKTKGVPGIQKAEISVDVIQGLASKLLTKIDIDNPILTLLVSEGGKALLKAATKGFKEAMNILDIDGDGEISTSEFTSIFACCCPKDK